MEVVNALAYFFAAIDGDPRIGVSHISVYCSLLQFMQQQNAYDRILVKSNEVMKMSKISGLATYHRCIRDLHDFGYIKYQPSYNHRKKSKVSILNKNQNCSSGQFI